MNGKKFLIVGAGIAGLTTGIALQKQGFNVKIYESYPEIKASGAGLILGQNALKAFATLDLDQEIINAGKWANSVKLKTDSGKILSHIDSYAKESAGDIRVLSVARTELHHILYSHLQPNTIETNKKCIDFEQNPTGVSVYFADGTNTRGDYLIAADGIHSVIRKKLLPHIQLRYSGYTCWRGITSIPDEHANVEFIEVWGDKGRFGSVPLSGNRVYWYTTINSKPENQELARYKVQDVYNIFKDYHEPIPQVLNSTKDDELIWNDIYDFKPIDQYAFERTLLIGDAAHATTPNMGQGACQAIEDAIILSGCLTGNAHTEEAFKRFESLRVKRVTKIINTSWNMGKIAHLKNPLISTIRNNIFQWMPENIKQKQLEFLYNVHFD